MTDAILSNILVERQDATTSPVSYDALEEVTDLSGVGETAPLVRATHFQSDSEEYIAGLADGDEISISCNRVHTSPSTQDQLVADKGSTITVRITDTDTSVSPNTTEVYTFQAVVLGWNITPQLGDVNKINYTLKISGGVTIS